jgi:ABC-type phosphate/phosphonate transport system substrate-binding protein
MCGWPYVRGVAEVVPVATPVMADPLAGGRPVYWTDLVVRVDDPARDVQDLRGRSCAFTVVDSQSGFSALRHFLRGVAGPKPIFATEIGPVFTPRRTIEAVISGAADAAPVDSYAHALIRLHAPELAAQIRVIARTGPTAAPLLVASAGLDDSRLQALRHAFLNLSGDAKPLLAKLAISGFATPLPRASYQIMEDHAQDAVAAGITRLETHYA